MGFSGAVKLSGLDDHITPSQSCVVALDGTKVKLEDTSEEVQIHARQPMPAPAMKKGDDGKAVKISLNDCLACSGCITTAETVLLQQQSLEEFLTRVSQPGVTSVVTLSQPTRASLGVYYSLSPAEAASRLAGFLKSLGVHAVLDQSCASDVSLMEAAAEFCYRHRCSNGLQPQSLTSTQGESPSLINQGPVPAPTELPMLASACPGWVCYAEKTHGAYVLPYISTVKSAQAVMGTLLKRQLAPCLGVPASSMFHCSLQPCYDKKLEATREDFEVDTAAKETDCVLSTLEVVDLLGSKGMNLRDCPLGIVDDITALLQGQRTEQSPPLQGWPGGSGGYADFVFRVAAKELYGVDFPPGPLPYRTLRNNDYREVSLDVNARTVLRFATAYGFRNIQTLMRKIKRGQCEYHYVEIMACPSGCLNGGGQMRPAEGQSGSDLIRQLDESYHHQDIAARWPGDSPLVQYIYSHLGTCFSEQSRTLFHTQYHYRHAITHLQREDRNGYNKRLVDLNARIWILRLSFLSGAICRSSAACQSTPLTT